MRSRRHRLAAALACCALLALAPVLARQQAEPLPLVEVRFEGLSRYAHDDIVGLTGLAAGRPVTTDGLTTLAQQLADTGLFTSIRYEYTTTDAGLTAVFHVTESNWTAPVVYDNFLSFTDDELTAAIARYVPQFDGTTTENGTANNLIGTAIQRVVTERGIQGRVVVIPRINIERQETVFAFALTDTGTNMTLCAIQVPGASGVSEGALASAGSNLLGRQYSRSTLAQFAQGTLQNMYRERGYWAATFSTPTGTRDGECDGVTASIGVTEGVSYRWAGADWTGVAGISTDDLDDALDMRTGEIADVTKLDEGLRRVQEAYERLGFLLQEETIEPNLDADTRQATFTIAVTEGPQFRMGTFAVEGLPDRNIEDITRRWRLEPGDIFDGVYLRTFMLEHRSRIQLDDGPFMAPDVALNRSRAVADVTIKPANTIVR